MSLAPGITVWSLLRERLRAHVDHVVLVLSPSGADAFARARSAADDSLSMEIRLQSEPRGMGDAVFCAEEAWRRYDDLLIVWGDQVGLSERTITETARLQRTSRQPGITLPLVEVARPYVQYDFATGALGADGSAALVRVRQSREGDACDERGLSDVGCFGLCTATENGSVGDAWRAHLDAGGESVGRVTGERNFLPFLPFFAEQSGGPVRVVVVADPTERLGINTPEELAYFQARLAPRG